mmetsp:Transcript_24780/g.76633  ORF Transcript_24780/g.76633 Transcript_24780/m.76633 type:complete len:98 (+) Transcript_24780:2282-2575(+)
MLKRIAPFWSTVTTSPTNTPGLRRVAMPRTDWRKDSAPLPALIAVAHEIVVSDEEYGTETLAGPSMNVGFKFTSKMTIVTCWEVPRPDTVSRTDTFV